MKIKSIAFNGRYIFIVFLIMLIVFIFKPYIIQWVLTKDITIAVEEPTEGGKSLENTPRVGSSKVDTFIEYYPIVDKVKEETNELPYYFGIHTLKGYFKVQVTEEVYNSYEIGSPIGVINKNGEYVFSENKGSVN